MNHIQKMIQKSPFRYSRSIRKEILIALLLLLFSPFLNSTEKYNFATATDTEHYSWTLNLIATIHRFHRDQIGEIAVYDIGLLDKERAHLNSIACVNVYDVEKTNPYIFDKFTVNSNSKVARGWYSWKPVAIKQASDKFSTFFYLDSGVTVVGPMDLLFEHLEENGYFLIDCGHTIGRMTIQPLIEKFELNKPENRWVLKAKGISAGIQGLSHSLYQSYILPIYELSFHIDNFADDGSCPKGFGWARHDQPLFSIQARLLGLQINEVIRGGHLKLKVAERTIKANLDDFIQISRGDFDLNQSLPYLKYKKSEEPLRYAP